MIADEIRALAEDLLRLEYYEGQLQKSFERGIALADRVEAVERDAARWQWALPILSGDTGDEADRRALALAGGIMQGMTATESVDAARKEQADATGKPPGPTA